MLTELDLQLRWLWQRWPRSLMIPNWTKPDWWEMDIAEISVAGYLREVEIKKSKGDLFADFEKMNERGHEVKRKHDLLSLGDPIGPAEYAMLVPEELSDELEIPDHAGVYSFTDSEDPYEHLAKRVQIHCVRRCPRLHNRKLDPLQIQRVLTTAYYRYHRLLWRLHRKRRDFGERAEGGKGW